MTKEIKHLRAIAIIPARAGSKRIPNKNVRSFCGDPIIKYSIDTAIKAGIFDEIMVSTENRKIAAIAKRYGAKVPFLRSHKTASDKVNVPEVLTEVLEEYKKRGIDFDYICCIYATAPLIEKKRVIEGYKMIIRSGVDSVIPVVRFDYPIQRALVVGKNSLEMIDKKNLNIQSQDLSPTYHDAGKFYWAKQEQFLKYKTFFMPKTRAIILPKTMAQDIDDIEDFQIAELKYTLKYRKFDWLTKNKAGRWNRKSNWIILLLALLSSALIMGSII